MREGVFCTLLSRSFVLFVRYMHLLRRWVHKSVSSVDILASHLAYVR